MNTQNRIAVLIDGDNANYKYIEHTLNQIAEYGEIVIKRVYGDWSKPQLASWKPALNKYSIKPIQVFNNTKGKNSTDIALIIDAMDILYSNKVNALCVVSTDCDFTGIIQRFRENGCYTIGIGKEQACNSFKSSCDTFLLESDFPKNGIVKENVSNSKEVVLDDEIYRIEAKKLPGLKVVGNVDVTKFLR